MCKNSCFLSLFYIKPQLFFRRNIISIVVSYLYSTSNHNAQISGDARVYVVSYLYSTSNHNCFRLFPLRYELFLIFILHQTTTPPLVFQILLSCFLSLFYIKPQLDLLYCQIRHCCFLSLFYIKPQHW